MLLQAWREGDNQALERLGPLVPDGDSSVGRALHEAGTARPSPPDHRPGQRGLPAADPLEGRKLAEPLAHFLGVAAQLMRHILVDFARKRPLADGKQEAVHVSLDEAMLLAPEKSAEVVAIDAALNVLAALDPRKSRIVELRYFGGLSVEETAEVLGISTITVIRDWNRAKAWLHRELSRKL